MRTNAQIGTIEKAVEIVSREQFGGNLIFREKPHHITKNVIKFTLRTKDKNKPGSYIDPHTKRKQPKASQEAYRKVLEQAFKLEPIQELYGDMTGGIRIYNDNWKRYAADLAKKTKKPVITTLAERKAKFPAIARSSSQKESVKSKELKRFVESLQYVIDNKDLLGNQSVLSALKG